MRGFSCLLVLAGLAGCDTNGAAVPSQPAFDVDVRPILMAHCVRCHGAGGKQNVPTEPTGPDAAVLASIRTTASSLAAIDAFYDQFGQTGDCTFGDGGYPPSCRFGASSYATEFTGFVRHGLPPDKQMPPPPAPVLDDWAIQTLTDWAAEAPNLICSRSASPDPALACP